MAFQIIQSNNQDKYEDISYIDLEECEKKLKSLNIINDYDSLIIAKFDIFIRGY